MYLLSHTEEGLTNVDALAGWALVDPDQPVVSAKQNCLLSVHFPLLWLFKHYVNFVSHQPNDTVFRCAGSDFFEPVGHVLKGVQAGDVKDKDHALGSPVVVLRHGTVSLTARSVPHLQINHASILSLN